MSNTTWILLAVVVAVLFGLSFVVKALLWVALIAAALWVVGFFVRGAEQTLST